MRVNSRRTGVFCFVALLATVTSACTALASPKLDVPAGFTIEPIASVGGARELAALPNGDLVVGTAGRDVYLVPNAESNPGRARVLVSLPDDLAAGVAFAARRSELLVATTHHVWAIADPTSVHPLQSRRIADVRAGPVAPGTDGDVHYTTSLAFSKGLVYVSAGSSCNARMNGGASPCSELDPTRAAVSVMEPSGSGFRQRAKRLRNGIALAVNPRSEAVWVGGAGQDDLAFGHPYEFLDDLSAHAGVADYGWPQCEEDHHAYWPGADCSHTVAPLIVLPAYSTIVGATFYPLSSGGHLRVSRALSRRTLRDRARLLASRPNGLLRRAAARRLHSDEGRRAGKAGRLDEPGDAMDGLRYRFPKRLSHASWAAHGNRGRIAGEPLCRRRCGRRDLSHSPDAQPVIVHG